MSRRGQKRCPLQNIKWVILVINENLGPESTDNKEKNLVVQFKVQMWWPACTVTIR